MRKKIGKVTEEQKLQIKRIFERRNGLAELAKIVTAENDELYEKLVKDMGETGRKFQQWWDDTSRKYNWESREDGHWEIDFNTNDVYLVTKE